MRTVVLCGVIASFLAAAATEAQEPKDLPAAPGARGNADNVSFIGKSDAHGNPVRLAKSTGHVSNYSEEKIPPYKLPNPLVMANGQNVTTAEKWLHERRPEILAIYETEVYGRVPANAPRVTWEVTESGSAYRDGLGTLKRVVGRMGDAPDGPKSLFSNYVFAAASRLVIRWIMRI